MISLEDIRFIMQFGSTVDGYPTAESDIDIGIVFKDKKYKIDKNKYYTLLDIVRNELKISCEDEEKLDIVIISEKDMLLAYEGIVKGKLLYGDEEDYAEYATYLMKRYNDWRFLNYHYYSNFADKNWLREGEQGGDKYRIALQKARAFTKTH